MNDVDLNALLDDLASPDPQLRDERALGEVCAAVTSGALTQEQRSVVADRMLQHLRHPEIQARTFAPLVLDVLLESGDWDDTWFEQTREWYLAESDLRGHDLELGWLHAIAHGADFFGAVARFGARPAGDCLDVLVERLLQPADLVWRDQEEARVAYAMALCLIRDPATIGALGRIEERLASAEVPPPAWAANTRHTLHALAAALDQQIVFNGEPIEMPDLTGAKARVLEVIQSTQPWFWTVRD